MSFYRRDENGKIIRNQVVIDCQKAIDDGIDELRTEQNHKGSVDINEIVSKAGGVDRIAATQNILAMSFDTNPYNNFEEMMILVAKGEESFMSLPAQVRDEFDNSPAKYMDFVTNPENKDALIERGWMNPPEPEPQPVEVIVTNPTVETPPE